MSFLFKGDEGPTNIPEGRAGGLFEAIAQAGLQSAQENNFGGRRRRVRSRMAGQREEDLRRSRLDDVRRGGRKGIKKGRPEGMPPRGPSKGTKHVTMRDPETGYKYGGKVVDGVPQFTKPDFSDRKPLPGYPKKETDRTSGRRGPNRPPRTGPGRPPRRGPDIRPPRDEVSIMPVPPRDEVSIMPVPPRGGRGGRGGRRSDPRPEGDRNRGRGGIRGRRRVKDEAFERRLRSGNRRSMTRKERRRRVRNANTPMIK